MPIYRVNGNRYNIPNDKIQDFESYYPEAKVEIYDGEGGKYALPLSIRNEFQERYDKWSYVTEETKKESPDPSGSNQNPPNIIVSEDELENSMADYEESLGHGKYGARNTPLFQKVRQAVTSAEQIADGIIDKNWISQSPSSSARDSEIGEVSVGRRGSTSTRTPVSDAYKSQFDKPLEDRFADARTRLEKDVVFQFENMLNKIEEDINENSEWRNEAEQIENEGDIFKNYKGYKNITEDTIEDLEREGYVPKEMGELSQKRSVQNLTRKYISEARDVIEMYKRKDGNGLANFADAFARSFDSGILTLGATDAIDMGRVLAIANKIGDNGEGFEKLTKEEQQLMAAFSLLDQIQGSLQLDTWQNIGQGTMQSLPFLAQFALTGGVGAAASAATKAAAKTAVKKIIGRSASKAVSRIAANAGKNAAGRVAVKAASKLGNAAIDGLVGGAVMALTSGAAHTAEDVMSRMVGDHDIRLGSINDPSGELKTIYTHHGVEDRESLGLAFLKGFAANLIENGTEYMGNYMGLNLGKLLSRYKGGRQLLTKPLIGKSTRFARQVGKLTGFNGFIPEVAEEELGMLLNAATVGDVEWEDIKDPEQQFQTVMAVGIMSLGFQVANSIGVGLTYNRYRKAKKRYESKDLGEGLSVDDIIHGLDNVPLDRRADYVMATVNTHDLGKEDAKDLQDFVMARTGYEFILGKIESDAEEAGDKAAEAEMRLINKEMGGKVTVTLLDGREAILTVGNVSLEPNAAGEYTSTTQSGSLIAVPVGIGNTPIMVSPKDIRSVSIMSTEDAVGQARAMAEDITKTNMASQIENEADEVESDEQSRTPSSTMSGGEIGELSPRDEGVEKQPLYRKSELEIGDVVTFNDYSDPENPGVERTLKIIGIDDSGVYVEDVVDGVPLPLSIKPEQITNVKGKEKNQTADKESGQQTTLQTEAADTSEYTRFVEDGTVEDSTVLRIANKIANGEQLTGEEEAMRQEVSQRVEDKLREIQQNVEGKEETDRWAKYRKSNGEVDEKKMPLREQFEYGEEIAGVKAMIEVAKAGTKKTQSEIARLEKEIEREISPVKRVNKEKQLKSLNERLGTYQQYLEDNNSDLQSLKATPVNIVDRIAALGDIKSLRDYILRLVATGNIKFKWGDTDSSKGLASHLGINDSLGERRKRISLLSNSGYTPEQLAHNIWEQQDVQNSDLPFKGYETDEILDEILDVMSSIYSPSQALELAEQIANEDLRKQEMASQDYESHELEQSSIEQIELEPLPDDLAPRNDIAFRRDELGETQSGQTQINERESNSNKENSLSSQEEKQIDSQDEILQSIPQRERGTEAQKDRRMEEAERAIRRSQSSGTNETQFGGSQSALSRQEIEARAAEEYAKENGLWIPMDKVFDLGTPGPSGNENDTYISNEGYVYKVNNLMNRKGILPLFDRIKLHNQIFPSSRYEFVGFTGFDGRSIYPIFRQAYVHESTNATPEEIEEYMNTLGFSKINEHKYTNGDITISDLRPRNVLKDTDGDLYVVDAEFQQEGRSDKETADKTNPRQPDNTDSTGSPLSENESSGISSSPTNSETPVSDIKDNPNASTGQEKPRLSTQKTLQERRQEIQEYIGREAGKLNIPVRVVEDVSQISPSEKNYTKKLKSQGWYDQTTGEIVIVAPNHGSIRDAQRTLLHEAVAHYGLSAMLGRENFDKLCDQVWDSMTDRERATFAAYLDDKSYDSLTEEEKEQYTANDFSGKRAAADEYLAHFAEEGITTPSLWNKIKRFVKEAFRKIGIDLSLTDSDIAYLLWKSKNRITDKDSMADIIRKSAADTRIKENIGNTRFRINTPVEQRGDLVAIHNISEDKLKEAIGLGGFPMPSIAITKPEVGHSTFGDISLVFGKETINPTDRRNKVYGEDAWTPTFPTVGYKLNEDKTSDIYRRANKTGNLPLFNPSYFHSDNYESYINGIDSDSLVNHFKDSYGAKQLYLAETGNAVEKFEMHEVEKYSEERIGFLEKVLKEIGIERLKKESYAELENEIKQILGKHYNVDFDKLKPSIARIRIDNAIKQAVDYAENGNSKTESDVEATKKKIDDRIDQKKFEEWLRNLFNGVVEKKGIRNETDLFTPIGNRRKWESLYDEITLDNVVKAMKKQSAKGGQGLFGGSIFGAAQSEFKNIDEIREAARERIRELSNEEIEGRRNEITDRLSQIDIPMRDKGIGSSFDMIENITDSVRHSHTAKGIYNYLHDIYPGMTMDIANEIADIVKDIQQMSARYFEAKPYRAVGFDEIKFAVVPDNTDVSLLNQLQSMKIPVETYEKGNNEQRKQVLNESSDKYDTRFRTIVVNPRYGSKIETVRTNHTSVYKAVDKYLRENFDEKDYTTHTAKTGSRYLELNIGGDTLKVRFANHTPRMEASDNMDTIGNGKEIAFFPGGDIEVEIDISLSGDRSKEIIDLIKGMEEYSSSEVKKEVSRLIDGAKTDPFPDVTSPQLIEELSRYIGTEMAGTLDTQIAEYYKYRVNENVYKQESKSRDSKLKQNKYVLEQYKAIFRDFVQESPKLIKAVGGGYWYNGATGSIRIVPPFPIDYGMLSDKLMSSHFIPLSGINKKEGKRKVVREYVDEWSRRLTDSGIFLSEEYVSEGAKITEAQQEIDNIREQYNFWVKAKFPSPSVSRSEIGEVSAGRRGSFSSPVSPQGNIGEVAQPEGVTSTRYRTTEYMEAVNQRFNEQLSELTEENADRIIMSLGRPSEILRSVDIPDRDIRLYGNKVMKKSKSHGYSPHDLKDLPKMIQHPIAIFKGSYPGSFSLLTEIELNGNNALVSIDIKKGEVQDINLVTSVYGKKGDNVLSWIEEGKMLYTDKKKTLDYISSSAPIADATYNQGGEKALNYLRIPAPIAGAQDNSELLSATNIVENFENPKLTGENSDGTMNTRFRREAPDVSSYIKISMDRKGVVDLSQLSPDQSQRIRKSAPAAYGAEISGDIASFPDYQEAENCLTYIFNNNDIISDDIRNSIDNGTLPQDIAMIFDAALRRGMVRRVWIDRYQPLEALQKLISSTLGKEIPEKENAWEYTGFMDSRIKAEADEYNADYYLPLLELYEKIIHGKNGVDEDTLVDYMLIKHGIERNQVMRREALEEWEESHKGVEDYNKKRTSYIQELSTRDYSGYFDRFKQEYARNYNTAEDFISEVESLLGENTVINLWDKIKKATNKTLDISVKSGLVSKEDADTYKKRFQFYVPLRGFSEETMDQMYDSNIRINPGSTVNKQAKGRTSRADNPLVSIMAMANTEIARANKNKMKQRLLTLLAGKDVRNKFGYSYKVEYKDGKEKILKYKPKQSDEIKKITTISNIYQIIPKYEILALDTNGNPILDEHGNKTWVETDEVPSAEQLESGMARFSKAYPSNRGTVHKTPSQMEESTVDVFVAGKKVSILFTNPLISNSINGRLNLDKNVPRKIETPDQWYNIPGWLTYGARHLNRLGARTTRALSQFYTTYSPAFFLFSNFARDFSGAFAYNSAEKSIAEARQIAALAPDSFAAMRRYIRGESKNKRYTIEEIESFLDRMGRKGKISKSDYDIAAYLFVSRGGETGYISANTVEDYRKSIDNAVKYGTVDMNKQAKAIKKGYMTGVKAIQDTARLMESVTRLNQFVAALREGKTIDAAITDAKNVSTNFNRRGSHEGIQWIFDNYAFLNASLQGTDRLYRGIKKYKKGFAKVIGTIISIGFLDSLLCAIFSDDDERWGDAYHALPETKRYNNLVIPVGESKFIFIPLAQSLRGFHAWGIMLADLMTGYHKRHPLVSDPITPLDFLAVIGQDIVPITYGSWTNAAPTWAQPIAHIAFNENFMGRPLYKETPWNENLPEFRKAYGSTPKGLVKWSEFVNEMTGGNYAEKGWLEQIPVLEKLNNPAVLQQLYLGYVPGLFRVLGQAYNAVDALVTKTKGRPTDFDLSDVPIIGAAVGEANDRIPKAKLRSKWYEFANKARDSKRADSELLKELFIDEFIENTRDSDKVLNKSVYDGLNVHIRNLMKLEGMAETWEDDLVSGDLPADEAIRTSAEIASLRNTIDNTLYDIINELKIAQ
ncbi:LPD38 domain-containing protein [Barnesiella intestinihominis]|uniref:putative polyvalent protein kinase domain-containing protein n=1 Tax=Barnesiella intestinihominis TaxID=487174 RepID=UPI003967AAA2